MLSFLTCYNLDCHFTVPHRDSQRMSAANDDLDPVKLKALGGSPSVSEHSVNADAENERQAVLRLDCTVLPVMTVFYLLSFLACTLCILPQSLLTSYNRTAEILVCVHWSARSFYTRSLIDSGTRKCSCRWSTNRSSSNRSPIPDCPNYSFYVRRKPLPYTVVG